MDDICFLCVCEMRLEMEKPSIKGEPCNIGSQRCRSKLFQVLSEMRGALLLEESREADFRRENWKKRVGRKIGERR